MMQNGLNVVPPTEIELTRGTPIGISLAVSEPAPSGPHQRANFILTPAEAQQIGDALIAYALANGGAGAGAAP